MQFVKCNFHSQTKRVAELLANLCFSPPSCSATLFDASPSAHNPSAAALFRRPPARHLAARRLFLEALLFAQSPPTGG